MLSPNPPLVAAEVTGFPSVTQKTQILILHHFGRFEEGILLTQRMFVSIAMVLLSVCQAWPIGLSSHTQWFCPMYVQWEALGMPGFPLNPVKGVWPDSRRMSSSPSSAAAHCFALAGPGYDIHCSRFSGVVAVMKTIHTPQVPQIPKSPSTI